MPMLPQKVYLRPGKEFLADWPTLDLDEVIEKVARVHMVDESLTPLIGPEGQVYKGRTKKFILREANSFVIDIQTEHVEGVDMKMVISKYQLNSLIRTFRDKNSKQLITAYALIIFHVIIELLRQQDGAVEDASIAVYVEALTAFIRRYIQVDHDNPIALFLAHCQDPVQSELEDENTHVTIDDFPGVPREHIKDLDDV